MSDLTVDDLNEADSHRLIGIKGHFELKAGGSRGRFVLNNVILDDEYSVTVSDIIDSKGICIYVEGAKVDSKGNVLYSANLTLEHGAPEETQQQFADRVAVAEDIVLGEMRAYLAWSAQQYAKTSEQRVTVSSDLG